MHWCPRSLPLITLLRFSLADALRIDDFDLKMVEYHGAWTDGHEIPDDPSLNWDSTLHYSNISGATATLKFTGTSIAVFGSFHPPGRYSMQSQYSVDGQQPSVFIPNQEVPASTHQTLFYSSPRFPHGEHTLVVTNLGEQLFLDFFDVQDEPAATPPSTTPAASTTGPNIPTQTLASSSGGGQTVTVTTLPSTSTTASESTITPISAAQSPMGASSRGLSKGAIAGIAVGSIIIVAVLGAALWWYYRRSHERTWLVTDLRFEPEKMSVPDPSFRGHRPTLPGLDRDARDTDVIYGERRASEQRRSAPSSSVHLVGYGSSTPSTCSE